MNRKIFLIIWGGFIFYDSYILLFNKNVIIIVISIVLIEVKCFNYKF